MPTRVNGGRLRNITIGRITSEGGQILRTSLALSLVRGKTSVQSSRKPKAEIAFGGQLCPT